METGIKQVNPGAGKARYYELPDGSRLPSVTQILTAIGKPALMNWAAKVEREFVIEAAAQLYDDLPSTVNKMTRIGFMHSLTDRITKTKAHKTISEKALDIGSATHKRVEWELRGRIGPEPVCVGEALWAFQAWETWWKDAGLEVVRIEQAVWSLTHGYAGTMDVLVKDRSGELVVVDFKTSKAIYGEACLQAAAYAHAVDEMGHGPVVRGLIVRLPKHEQDPGFETREVKELADLLPVFLCVLETWKWQQKEDERWRRENGR